MQTSCAAAFGAGLARQASGVGSGASAVRWLRLNAKLPLQGGLLVCLRLCVFWSLLLRDSQFRGHIAWTQTRFCCVVISVCVVGFGEDPKCCFMYYSCI